MFVELMWHRVFISCHSFVYCKVFLLFRCCCCSCCFFFAPQWNPKYFVVNTNICHNNILFDKSRLYKKQCEYIWVSYSSIVRNTVDDNIQSKIVVGTSYFYYCGLRKILHSFNETTYITTTTTRKKNQRPSKWVW